MKIVKFLNCLEQLLYTLKIFISKHKKLMPKKRKHYSIKIGTISVEIPCSQEIQEYAHNILDIETDGDFMLFQINTYADFMQTTVKLIELDNKPDNYRNYSEYGGFLPKPPINLDRKSSIGTRSSVPFQFSRFKDNLLILREGLDHLDMSNPPVYPKWIQIGTILIVIPANIELLANARREQCMTNTQNIIFTINSYEDFQNAQNRLLKITENIKNQK
jgi:hypothetical protein